MNPKLVLAEGLELLKKAEMSEAQVDKLQERVTKSSKMRSELSRLKNEYSRVYDMLIQGLEMINFVRRAAMNVDESALEEYCAGRMKHYMDRCERVRQKEANILLPISQLGEVTKEGFSIKETVLALDPAVTPISKKAPWSETIEVCDGSYLVLVRNEDQYTVAAPTVEVIVCVRQCDGKVQTFKKIVPSRCGWCRFVGLVGKGTLTLSAQCDSVLRNSHVGIEVKRLEEKGDDVSWMSSLPRIDDLMEVEPEPKKEAVVDEIPIPRGEITKSARIEVNPQSATVSQRLQLLRRKLDEWPASGVSATLLAKNEQFVLQAVHNLPIPTDICGDCDFAAGVDFKVDVDELEGR